MSTAFEQLKTIISTFDEVKEPAQKDNLEKQFKDILNSIPNDTERLQIFQQQEEGNNYNLADWIAIKKSWNFLPILVSSLSEQHRLNYLNYRADEDSSSILMRSPRIPKDILIEVLKLIPEKERAEVINKIIKRFTDKDTYAAILALLPNKEKTAYTTTQLKNISKLGIEEFFIFLNTLPEKERGDFILSNQKDILKIADIDSNIENNLKILMKYIPEDKRFSFLTTEIDYSSLRLEQSRVSLLGKIQLKYNIYPNSESSKVLKPIINWIPKKDHAKFFQSEFVHFLNKADTSAQINVLGLNHYLAAFDLPILKVPASDSWSKNGFGLSDQFNAQINTNTKLLLYVAENSNPSFEFLLQSLPLENKLNHFLPLLQFILTQKPVDKDKLKILMDNTLSTDKKVAVDIIMKKDLEGKILLQKADNPALDYLFNLLPENMKMDPQIQNIKMETEKKNMEEKWKYNWKQNLDHFIELLNKGKKLEKKLTKELRPIQSDIDTLAKIYDDAPGRNPIPEPLDENTMNKYRFVMNYEEDLKSRVKQIENRLETLKKYTKITSENDFIEAMKDFTKRNSDLNLSLFESPSFRFETYIKELTSQSPDIQQKLQVYQTLQSSKKSLESIKQQEQTPQSDLNKIPKPPLPQTPAYIATINATTAAQKKTPPPLPPLPDKPKK